jgi:hypothetical protein
MAATGVKKAAETTVEAAHFDVEAFITGFKAPEFDAHLYQKGSLIPRIVALQKQINDAADSKEEFSIEEGDPTAAARVEFESLNKEFEKSKVTFHFRVVQDGDMDAVWAEMVEDKIPGTEDKTEMSMDDVSMAVVNQYLIARTCLSHPLTGSQWHPIRLGVGETAFMQFVNEWAGGAYQGQPTAPFSLPASRTPGGAE